MSAPGILVRVAMGHHAQKQDAEAMDALMLLLGAVSDLRHVPGHEELPMGWALSEEERALGHLRQILGDHCLPAGAIARFEAQLQALYLARGTPYDVVSRLGDWWREQFLNWEREQAPGFPSPYDDRTSWRCAFSARLGRAMALSHVERFWNGFRGLEHLPSPQWMPALEQLIQSENSFAAEWPLGQVRELYQRECSTLRMWTCAGIALAIARYEVEQNAFPMTLSDLCPRYLESVPPCPEGGEAFTYSAGSFKCSHSASRWRVGRCK
jgi:hypothetical protein